VRPTPTALLEIPTHHPDPPAPKRAAEASRPLFPRGQPAAEEEATAQAADAAGQTQTRGTQAGGAGEQQE